MADQLKEGPVEVESLAKSLNVGVKPLYRILRTLAAEGVFQEGAGRKFSLGEKGQCLRTDLPCSMRNAVVMYGAEQFKAWSNLDSSLTDSTTPFEKTYSTPVFNYFKDHPESGMNFNKAMKELGTQIYSDSNIASAYDFKPYSHLIDIGGGNGSFLKEVLSRSSSDSRGTLFDLPEVVRTFKGEGNISVVGGDFFKSIPAGGDLYLLKRVLHDWDDDKAIAILTQVRKAISDHGKVLLVEYVIEKDSSLAHWLDLHMMVMTGGYERTDQDFAKIFEKSGFMLNRIIHTKGKLSIIEAGVKR